MKTCDLCGGPVQAWSNKIGVCRRNPECKAEWSRRQARVRRAVCDCGKPMHRGAKRCWDCTTAAWPDRRINSDGYVLVASYDHPRRSRAKGSKKGWIAEHTVVMEKMLGRYLLPGEEVHHKDTDRQNNDPGNLQLRMGRHGKGGSFQCVDCGSHNIVAVEI